MKRFILAAGVAALAISVPAVAKPDKGGERGGHATQAKQDGGGRARAARAENRSKAREGGQRRAETRQRQSKRVAEVRRERSKQVAEVRRERSKQVAEARRERSKQVAEVRRERSKRLAEVRRDRSQRQVEVRRRALDDRADRIRDVREARRDRIEYRRDALRDRARVQNAFWTGDDDRWDRRVADRGLINGCPPGLFAKDNGCLPPGQARKLIGQRIPSAYRASALPRDLRDYYRDNDDYYYRYGDGYLYRVDRQNDLVSALLPLFGGGLTLGSQFPSAYSNYAMPSAYSAFYPDSRDNYYRYANGYVYGVDRDSGLIDDIVPLMAGGYGVGQLMPASYGVYNVPYQYRGYYPDSSDAYYRYAPGAIYQVDPQTNLITSVASLLSPTGFAVGQPLPPAYSAYNVPLGYRDQYYDTPDAWYRYNNGSIYQVDPTTQLITAVISALV